MISSELSFAIESLDRYSGAIANSLTLFHLRAWKNKNFKVSLKNLGPKKRRLRRSLDEQRTGTASCYFR
jgi:hypothetical protein